MSRSGVDVNKFTLAMLERIVSAERHKFIQLKVTRRFLVFRRRKEFEMYLSRQLREARLRQIRRRQPPRWLAASAFTKNSSHSETSQTRRLNRRAK
jgi:hypothetical protein